MVAVLNSQNYSTSNGILQFSTGWQAWAHTFTLTEDERFTEERYGHKVIPAGTIWPSNDVNAKGVVLYDVDITDGEGHGALLFQGAVNENKVPAKPTKDTRTVLPRITWFPTISTPGLGNVLDPVEIPAATTSTMGGLKVGEHLNMRADGLMSVPEASREQHGVIRLGDTLAVDVSSGSTNVVAATATQRGGIRAGNGITMTGDLATVNPQRGITVDGDGVSVDTGHGLQIQSDNHVGVSLANESGLTVDADGLRLSDATKSTLEESREIEHDSSLTGKGTKAAPLTVAAGAVVTTQNVSNALKAKSQITALTALENSADNTALINAVNAIIAALKA